MNSILIPRLQWLVLACVLFIGAVPAVRGDAAASFDAANKLYEQGKYPAAIESYRKMIQAGNVSASVYFNLGNAFFKAGRAGEAVACSASRNNWPRAIPISGAISVLCVKRRVHRRPRHHLGGRAGLSGSVYVNGRGLWAGRFG